jgi:hypothetical protein
MTDVADGALMAPSSLTPSSRMTDVLTPVVTAGPVADDRR